MNKYYSRKSIDKVRRDYNTIASHYAVTRQYALPECLFFKPYIKKNMAIADIGCGSGRGLLFLRHLDISVSYVGMDIAAEQLQEARKRFPEETFLEGNMVSLPLDNEQFEIVLMLASLHHLPTKEDRLQALKEVFRILKPGGILCMTNWNMFQKKSRKYFMANVFRFLFSLGRYSVKDFFFPWKNNEGASIADRYYYAFTKRELEKLCRQAGFTIVKNIYTKGDKEGTIFSAYNLVTIGKKVR